MSRGVGEAARQGGWNLLRQKAYAWWLHTGCCSSASPLLLLLLPRLLLGQGQLGRTRPRGHN